MQKIYIVLFLSLLPCFLLAQKAKVNTVVKGKNVNKGFEATIADTQYAAIDRKALQIPAEQTSTTSGIADYIKANFRSDEDKARAAYIWVASNFSYDVENMYAINFYEKKEDRIAKALATHKGICAHYASVLNDINRKAGLQSYEIIGYVKKNDVVSNLTHAWCAVQIDSRWYLCDPTWGSGYVSNSKFVRLVSNYHFKIPPTTMIKNRIPFDPMWEFLEYPVTNQEFYEGKTEVNKAKPFFSYRDSIAAYDKLDENEQLAAAGRRIEANGVKNSMVYDRLEHVKRALEVNRRNGVSKAYNLAYADYSEAIRLDNVFINYKNNQFIPLKPDAEIKQMLIDVDEKIKSAEAKLAGIKEVQPDQEAMLLSLRKSIDEIKPTVEDHKEFLVRYFRKGKAGRRSMFVTHTWMGIPID